MDSMQTRDRSLHVSVALQIVEVRQNHRILRTYPVSTSKYGIGMRPGSFKTPLGWFQVAETFGHGLDPHTIFVAREAVGIWNPRQPQAGEDLILSRILWLEGREPMNANTKDRYVYFHGTNEESLIGRPASHGCVRLRCADMVELFELVQAGTQVWIDE